MEISTRMKSGIEGRMKEKHHTQHTYSADIYLNLYTRYKYINITYTFEDRFLFKFFC